MGTYVALTGDIVNYLGEDYYTSRDSTGSITVEISSRVRQGRDLTRNTTVRILAEVDRNSADQVYLWVESLNIFSS